MSLKNILQPTFVKKKFGLFLYFYYIIPFLM